MPQGGRLTICAANVEVTEADCAGLPDAQPGLYVRLTVADTGTGIPCDIQDKIFDPFFTTKEYGKGTGLGLSTVLGIVKGHGGAITLTSEAGKGTEFQILLPAADTGPAHAAAAESRPSSAGHGELILVVDDEASVRNLLKRNLEASGYTVLTAQDGSEGVALYAQHQEQIRLVLTDMMMPRIDGLGLARAVHAINPGARIIAGSGLAASADTADKAGAAFRAFLHKPYTAETLLRTVSDVLLGA
jgi:CheY-like chemotaxis protein